MKDYRTKLRFSSQNLGHFGSVWVRMTAERDGDLRLEQKRIWTDRWMYGWMDRWKDGWLDSLIPFGVTARKTDGNRGRQTETNRNRQTAYQQRH